MLSTLLGSGRIQNSLIFFISTSFFCTSLQSLKCWVTSSLISLRPFTSIYSTFTVTRIGSICLFFNSIKKILWDLIPNRQEINWINLCLIFVVDKIPREFYSVTNCVHMKRTGKLNWLIEASCVEIVRISIFAVVRLQV